MDCRKVITRAEIDQQQAEWEAHQEDTVSLVHEDGKFILRGLDMSNFRSVVGPETYYAHLSSIGEAKIIEPTRAQKIGRKVSSLFSSS